MKNIASGKKVKEGFLSTAIDIKCSNFQIFVFIYNVVRSSVISGGSEDGALHALKR